MADKTKRDDKKPKVERLPFLKPGDLGRGENELKIGHEIRTYAGGSFGPQIILQVELDGDRYDWSMKINGKNHIALETKFGRNMLNWIDQTVAVERETFTDDKGEEKSYIAIAGSQG
jgi:hypothetical protein